MATGSVTGNAGRPTAAQFQSQSHTYAFGLLGPLEVWVDGRKLELPRGKARLLLGLLLLHVREVLPKDRLIE